MAKLEAVIAARQQEEEEARLKREQDKEMAVRSQQKEKVDRTQHIHHNENVCYLQILLFITRAFLLLNSQGLCVSSGRKGLKKPFFKKQVS